MRGSFDGLVLREADYGENDKLITVLNAERGQCRMIAKGARSPRSETMALCRMFAYGNFEFYQKSGRYWLSGGHIEHYFSAVSSDIKGFALGAYIMSLCAEITGEGVPCADVLSMTLNTLYAIEKKLKPLDQIKAVYEIFAAEVSGFAPDISGCCECFAGMCNDGFWLDVMNGQIRCAHCRAKKNYGHIQGLRDELATASIILPLDPSALEAWRYVSTASPKRIFSFSITDAASFDCFCKSAETYIINHLEKSFETLDFYHLIKD